jgi:hypothetical protein
MRRWNEINFCKRLRAMRKAFEEEGQAAFGLKVDLDDTVRLS